MTLVRAIVAELAKLATMPSVVLSILGSVVAAPLLAWVLAAGSDPDAPTSALAVVAATVAVVQAGPILVAVLAVGTEYAGRQIATTLVAVPRRGVLLAAKAIATLAVVAILSALMVALATVAATWTLAEHAALVDVDHEAARLVGAAASLVLVAALAFGLAVTLRSTIAPLVSMLTLVLAVSPLVATFSEHARWLPDRAGALLYLPTGDEVLSRPGGGLVLVAWVVAVGIIGVVGFVRRDA